MKYVLPVLSALFMVYGAVHSMVYYGVFGISVQNFFSVEDYLRANINNLASFFVPLCVGFLIAAVTSHDTPPTNEEVRRKRRYRSDEEAGLLCVMMAGFTIILAGRREDLLAISSLSFVAAVAWIQFSWRLLPAPVIQPLIHRSVLLAVIVVDMVPATLGWNALAAVHQAHEVRTQRTGRVVSIQFTDDAAGLVTMAPSDSLVIIGMTSNYCFLYERGPSCTHVVPTRYIKHIRVGALDPRPAAESL